MARLAGSMWSEPPQSHARSLRLAAEAGLRVVHWDCSDAVFAAAGGFDAEQARALSDGLGLENEAHLMMVDPGDAVREWAGFCSMVVAPLECRDPLGAMRAIERAGATPGLAVSPTTPIEAVPDGDFPVLVMSVRPGQAGSQFLPEAPGRVRELAERRSHRLIGADGGVGHAQLPELAAAGADWVVSGTALFGAEDQASWLARAALVLDARRTLAAGG